MKKKAWSQKLLWHRDVSWHHRLFLRGSIYLPWLFSTITPILFIILWVTHSHILCIRCLKIRLKSGKNKRCLKQNWVIFFTAKTFLHKFLLFSHNVRSMLMLVKPHGFMKMSENLFLYYHKKHEQPWFLIPIRGKL